MPVLALDELTTYAPGISVSGNEAYFQGLIYRVQAFLESDLGANRPLEVTQFIEHQELSLNYLDPSFYLRHFPVIDPPVPVFEQREGFNWRPLSTTPRVASDGRVETQSFLTYGFFTMPVSVGFPCFPIRVTYSAGFDFTATTPEVSKIKAIAGNLLQVLFNADGGADALDPTTAVNQSIEEYSVQGGERVRRSERYIDFSTTALAANDLLQPLIKGLLLPLKAYAPRQISPT